MTTEPTTPTGDGETGRDKATGRFLPGNRCGRGSPLAAAAQRLRVALFRAVKVGDVRGIIGAMVERAKGGDVAAAKLVLQYTLGEPQPLDILERLESLETLLNQESEQ